MVRRARTSKVPALLCSLAAMLSVLLPPQWAAAWGPHSEITRAGMAVLPHREAAAKRLGDEWPRLADYAWIPDWESDIHFGVYTNDFLLMPASPRHVDHMVPAAKAIYAPLFRRCLQALRTENSFNAARWIGSLLHYIEDSGSPPHAAGIGGNLHFKMENWLDAKRIQIDGYFPILLGRTDDEAVRGFEARMERLIEFSRERALQLQPILEPLDQRADQELILECALEVSRTVADALHTLFELGLAPIEPLGCSLRGRVQIQGRDTLTATGARIMLAGTELSTISDAAGHYEFRNLPPGPTVVLAMATGAELGRSDPIELHRDQPSRCDLSLQPDRAGENIVRNPSFELTWHGRDIPDFWQRDPQSAERWSSLPAPIPAGSTLRLSIEFVGNAVPIRIRWRSNGRVVSSGTTVPIDSANVSGTSLSTSISADPTLKPAYGESIFVEVLVETDRPLPEVCRHVALVPVTTDKD